MGKRSDFVRVQRDFYPTPAAAVEPLRPHLPKYFTFIEPCAGNGALVGHLTNLGGECLFASDIEPLAPWIEQRDAMALVDGRLAVDFVITNPPWDRKFLHPFIEGVSKRMRTWLLFDADWMHTKQAAPYLPRCEKIVSVGRVKWFPDSRNTGKDNCCWYLFSPSWTRGPRFYGR